MPLRRDTTTNNNAFGKMVCNLRGSKEFDTAGGEYVQTRESGEREVQRETKRRETHETHEMHEILPQEPHQEAPRKRLKRLKRLKCLKSGRPENA